MKQHFESSFEGKEFNSFSIYPVTEDGCLIAHGFSVLVDKTEITQACINRIVDNLNKLAEHNAKLDAANKNGAS